MSLSLLLISIVRPSINFFQLSTFKQIFNARVAEELKLRPHTNLSKIRFNRRDINI